MDNELFSPEEMQSPFEAIKETDAEGREWWNSRKLARLLGYLKYWNFERLIDKVATFLQQEKGLDLKEHMVEIEEMAQLNNGGWRQVKSIKLSRTACIVIATKADKKKPIVKAAREYFTSELTRPASYTDLTLSISYVYQTNETQLDFTVAAALNKSFNHMFLTTAELYASLLIGIGSLEKLSPVIAVKSSGVIVISSKGR